MQDVRYALRGLWHNKTMAGIAISCLALGMGINTTIFGTIGGVGLLLAAMGVFGVVASSVAQRMKEMGVRIALGAYRGVVFRLVLGQGLKLAAVGVIPARRATRVDPVVALRQE